MGQYTKITSAVTTTLIAKESKRTGTGYTGGIKKITIANERNSDTTTIDLYLDDGTTALALHPRIIRTDIPPKAVLVLEDNLDFDKSKYNLKITNAGTSPNITVIIK